MSSQIKTLDLEPIIIKAMDADDGYKWSLNYAQMVSEEYKKYLTLCYLYPKESVVPCKEVDKFWHLHILDTQKYAADCEIIFGHLLHHFPYFGMRGKEDKKNLDTSFEKTLALYAKHFSDTYSLWTVGTRCPSCGRRTKGVFYTLNIRPSLHNLGRKIQ